MHIICMMPILIGYLEAIENFLGVSRELRIGTSLNGMMARNGIYSRFFVIKT